MEPQTEEFRIYKVTDARLKSKQGIAWEVVSKLEIGEAVKMPLSVRFHLISKAKEAGIFIRTLKIPGKDEIEVIRIAKRN